MSISSPYSSFVRFSQARCASSLVGARKPLTCTNSNAERGSAFTTLRHHLDIVGSSCVVAVFVSIVSLFVRVASTVFYGQRLTKMNRAGIEPASPVSCHRRSTIELRTKWSDGSRTRISGPYADCALPTKLPIRDTLQAGIEPAIFCS